jgi:hypothetical protein
VTRVRLKPKRKTLTKIMGKPLSDSLRELVKRELPKIEPKLAVAFARSITDKVQ